MSRNLPGLEGVEVEFRQSLRSGSPSVVSSPAPFSPGVSMDSGGDDMWPSEDSGEEARRVRVRASTNTGLPPRGSEHLRSSRLSPPGSPGTTLELSSSPSRSYFVPSHADEVLGYYRSSRVGDPMHMPALDTPKWTEGSRRMRIKGASPSVLEVENRHRPRHVKREVLERYFTPSVSAAGQRPRPAAFTPLLDSSPIDRELCAKTVATLSDDANTNSTQSLGYKALVKEVRMHPRPDASIMKLSSSQSGALLASLAEVRSKCGVLEEDRTQFVKIRQSYDPRRLAIVDPTQPGPMPYVHTKAWTPTKVRQQLPHDAAPYHSPASLR